MADSFLPTWAVFEGLKFFLTFSPLHVPLEVEDRGATFPRGTTQHGFPQLERKRFYGASPTSKPLTSIGLECSGER